MAKKFRYVIAIVGLTAAIPLSAVYSRIIWECEHCYCDFTTGVCECTNCPISGGQ